VIRPLECGNASPYEAHSAAILFAGVRHHRHRETPPFTLDSKYERLAWTGLNHRDHLTDPVIHGLLIDLGDKVVFLQPGYRCRTIGRELPDSRLNLRLPAGQSQRGDRIGLVRPPQPVTQLQRIGAGR
jgi:hypothetical protein